MSSFASRLNKAMELRNMKQSELVEKTGITKGAISQYLKGKYAPKQINIYKISKALQVNPVWLMGKEVDMESGENSYYLNNDVRKLAQELFDNRELKLVMDSSRKLSKKSLIDLKNIIDNRKVKINRRSLMEYLTIFKDLPTQIKALTVKNRDDSYTVILNSRLSYEQQQRFCMN